MKNTANKKLDLSDSEKILVYLDRIVKGRYGDDSAKAASLCRWYLLHKKFTYKQIEFAKSLITKHPAPAF